MGAPEKMELTSMDVAAEKREALKRMLGKAFPEIFSEGSIDFDELKRSLGDWVEPSKERYGLNWPGKAECMKIIQQPSSATLKPKEGESVNFDKTENLFIEGDNLETLKLLQKSYFCSIKMIYIDPPYNTGSEFIYPDKYAENLDAYLSYTGQLDGSGSAFSTNTEASGRYHSRWLNMMYSRLYLARNLLRDDGILFISINDKEAANLRLLCDQIFGEENFISQLIWNTEGNTDNQAEIKDNHEYILVYCKDIERADAAVGYVIDPNTREDSNLLKGFADNNITKNGSKNPPRIVELPSGFPCAEKELTLRGEVLDTTFFEVTGREKYISDAIWDEYNLTSMPVRLDEMQVKNYKLVRPCRIYSGYANYEKLSQFISNGLSPIHEADGETRFYLNRNGCVRYRKQRSKARNILSVVRGVGTTERQRSELKKMGVIFDYPKPVGLLEYLVQIGADAPDSIVLDFFAGSCTTAEAVMRVNEKYKGNRQFIMVQLPEPCASESEAFKAGYKNICQLGRDRIKKVSQRISGSRQSLPLDEGDIADIGFRSFQLSKSNFLQWDGDVSHFDETGAQLQLHVDNVSSESRPHDILFELLLKAGFPLTTPVEEVNLAGKIVFSIGDGALLICLESEITPSLLDAIAEANPLQVICLDEGFKGNDQLKANAVQTFKARAQAEESEIVFKTV
jgi:adenine-specific DNA-methyltransferase